MRAAHALLTLGAVAAVGCASARQPGELDAAAEVDGRPVFTPPANSNNFANDVPIGIS